MESDRRRQRGAGHVQGACGLALVAMFVVAFLLDAALTARGGVDDVRGSVVRFQVTGTGSTAEVTLSAPAWRVSRARVAVPLRLTSGEPVIVRVPTGSDVSLSASSVEEHVRIRCEIDVDGAAIDVQESSSAGSEVQCTAHVAEP